MGETSLVLDLPLEENTAAVHATRTELSGQLSGGIYELGSSAETYETWSLPLYICKVCLHPLS